MKPLLSFLFTMLSMLPVALSAQTLIASYPLATDLKDTTTTYADIVLTGKSTPPAPPTVDAPLCQNGIYFFDSDGQSIETPEITGLDTTNFQLNIDFNLAELPSSNEPVIVAGKGYRWIALYINSAGKVGAKYNNSNYTWSETTVIPNSWHSAQLRFKNGQLQIFLDGTSIHLTAIGALVTGDQMQFLTDDRSNAAAFNGCIRNFDIFNDTTVQLPGLIFCNGFEDESCPNISQ